jgi:hypothetical protein
MSMPEILLQTLDARKALATIVGSIALQEAAISHVLNAEGEKIQAAAGMTGATLGDLQDINNSAKAMINNIALFEDDLQHKLGTALTTLYPSGDLQIYFLDSSTLAPVDCQCVLCTLTNLASQKSSSFYAQGDTLTLNNLKPGTYNLNMVDACPDHEVNESNYTIFVDDNGNPYFDGSPVTDQDPAYIELSAAYSIAAQSADDTASAASPANAAQVDSQAIAADPEPVPTSVSAANPEPIASSTPHPTQSHVDLFNSQFNPDTKTQPDYQDIVKLLAAQSQSISAIANALGLPLDLVRSYLN